MFQISQRKKPNIDPVFSNWVDFIEIAPVINLTNYRRKHFGGKALQLVRIRRKVRFLDRILSIRGNRQILRAEIVTTFK